MEKIRCTIAIITKTKGGQKVKIKSKVTQPKSPLSKSKVTAPVKKSKTRPEALKKIKGAVQQKQHQVKSLI